MNITESRGFISGLPYYFNPILWLDMAVKSMFLFVVIWLISRIIDKNIPRFEEGSIDDGDPYVLFAEVMVQIGITTIIVFIFKTFLQYICDEYDLLDTELSQMSWIAASLYIPFSLFNMSKNLQYKLDVLGDRYINW